MERLQQILRKKINGKRYLLVLDDIWNEEQEKWNYLKRLLLDGGAGSKVIVTTRSKVVARITGTMPAYDLKAMNKEKSWALFKKIALEQGRESNISCNISEIGKRIVDKCGGNPLAIKTIGALLRLKSPETEWSLFMEREFSQIPQTEDDIIPTLKLSYDHLPSSLKQCFVYSSLFPKDHVIDIEILVQLWMAQGFIKRSDPNDCLEDVGYEFFKELLWRSFFEEVETDENGNVTKCKMHDLMHDLAESITSSEFDRRNGIAVPINRRTRHVFLYEYGFDLVRKIQPSLIHAKKMRTILRPDADGWQSWYTITGGESTWDAIALNLKLLRTLDLQYCHIGKVPKSIGKLKHLRYLDLSYNGFKVLPHCVTRLHNLQTLKLSWCDHLQVLPKDINKLINLRSLEIDGCLSLKYMPRGIGELSSLCKLSKFTLSKRMSFFSTHQGGGGLDELGRLNNLRGSLKIKNLRIHAIVQPMDANLREKQHLRSLSLSWIEDVKLEEITEAVAKRYDMQLNALQPHPNLKDLSIESYHGVRFPNWFESHINLVTLCLGSCYKCQHLPPLHQLPCLKELWLYKLDALEYVSKDEYLSCSSSSSSTLIFFPSLERLDLKYLSNLKGWWRRSDSSSATASSSHDDLMLPIFPDCLSDLIIQHCPSLTCMPLFPYVSQRLELRNTSWKPFEQTILSVSGGGARPINVQPSSSSSSSSSSTSSYYSPLRKLTSLAIHSIHDLQFLPDELKSLTSLKDLHIGYCQELKSLYPGIQHLTSLQSLRIENCKKLDMCDNKAHAITMWQQPLKRLQTLSIDGLPQLLGLPIGLQHLNSLQKLYIYRCHNLVSLPESIKSLISLQYLKLYDCPKLASLPEEITSLISLHTLEIQFCGALSPRCERETGEDWPQISHIPDLRIH
ncbi:disease resistance protein RGA2-like [Ziziphus jujuba]|uniref:Disease resistance protein RGA2-like n=1 Tax=Ziziphus jujuba TaxID=326968 RepID=A0ABM3IKV2_ZIZJJ|nr:disease resistance protein RGA2-like [Ziziphus jujuba]